ncbi:MAG: CDP-diacylglycerol--glycerol-3-phosphate 3-phosphatidyltransferase [Clostridia bacterium]|nr:CDP-diacylglycerol--glycerol-3-phosphate 3-phosphatidyltransferase [Clostridia bacterium]
MLKKMNLPNKLTMLRIILVPVFIVFMCLPKEWVWTIWTAFGVFVVAAITDFLDGRISRKNNMVTKFGKIMDPLADKMLVSAGFILLTGAGVVPAWMTAIIILRDFFVNALRMFGSDKGKDVAAGLSGKIKTIFQLVGVVLGLFGLALGTTNVFGEFIASAMSMDILTLMVNVTMTVSVSVAVIATIWSMVDYIIRFKDDINVEE